MNSSPAILLFSRTAETEARHKQLVAGQGDNLALLQRMQARTLRLIEETELPYYVVTEREQRGATFGEKMTKAVAEVFAAGHEQLIVLGNDCPQLQAADLRKAAVALAQGRSVLGRDRHDGAYLIGLQRGEFELSQFAALPWQSGDLFAALRVLVEANSTASVEELRVLTDLNSRKDLRKIWRNLLADRLLGSLLGQIFTAKSSLRRLIVSFQSQAHFLVLSLRGPPVLA